MKNSIPKLAGIALACALPICSIAQAKTKNGYNLTIPIAVEMPRRALTASNLLTLREIGGVSGKGLSVSPDGNYVAFELHQANVAMNSYRVAWFVASTSPGTATVNVGDGGDPALFRLIEPNGFIGGAWISNYAAWSPDSRGIAYRKNVDKETQIWWSSREGEEIKQLTHNAADVETFYWSPDGSRIYFATDADRDELQELHESRYRAGYVFDYDIQWSTIDGRPYYPPYSLTDGRPRIWVLDVEAQIERLAIDKEIAEYQELSEPANQRTMPPGARRIARAEHKIATAWLQPEDREKQGFSAPVTVYASLAADGSAPMRCPAAECTGPIEYLRRIPWRDGIHWNTEEDEVLFAKKTGMGYSKRTFYGWTVGQQRVRKILTTDKWISDCSVVRGRAICFRETPVYPRTVISINLADGAIETLVDPNPEFRHVVLGEVELMEWKNARGHETFGYLVKPPDYVPGRRYPLVFVGYRARYALRGGVGNEYPVHLLAANGFVVISYDKPTPYEAYEVYADPIDINKARWGPDLFDFRMPLASFESAIRILRENGLVDPTRVGVTGLSNGVGQVNYAIIHSDLFAAAITSSSDFGPSQYFLMGANGDIYRQYRSAMGTGQYGSPEGSLWQHISLALNAGHVNTPLLVNAPDYEHPWALEEVITLIDHNKPVEMVVYPDEYHNKWQPRHRLAVYERNVDWLNFWLQGVEDPAPTKAQQYQRWHKLRQLHDAIALEREEARTATVN